MMGIASNILWTLFGLLYLLYQAFKEHPAETIEGTLKGGASIVGVFLGVMLVRFFFWVDDVVGPLIVIAIILIGTWIKVRENNRETEGYIAMIEEYDRQTKEAEELDALCASDEPQKDPQEDLPSFMRRRWSIPNGGK